jgi:hypothetical protein
MARFSQPQWPGVWVQKTPDTAEASGVLGNP